MSPQERSMDKPQVRLLVLTTCFQCRMLKEMLKEHGVAFESTDVDLMMKEDRDELFESMKGYNDKRAFPVTFIGEEVIVGFQKSLIMDTLELV